MRRVGCQIDDPVAIGGDGGFVGHARAADSFDSLRRGVLHGLLFVVYSTCPLTYPSRTICHRSIFCYLVALQGFSDRNEYPSHGRLFMYANMVLC
jgi:hypothetical protein